MSSQKQFNLEKKITDKLTGKALEAAEFLFNDEEIQHLQDYANTVSIKRLGFNDHGPVHMRQVMLNAVKMAELLQKAGIKLSLESDEIGTFEESIISILTAALLHDLGMSVGRDNHEMFSISLGLPIINRLTDYLFPGDLKKKVIIRSTITECIAGHMGTQKVHSLEAGIVLIADGCDMQKGRARIPMMIHSQSRVGDIHKYSSSAIEKVKITKGTEKPIKIDITMSESVGFFQVEEVLFPKITSSPIKAYLELYAAVEGAEKKRYL
jgi:metal-dependent HD superfamily phosphatase/phosphodiesterase